MNRTRFFQIIVGKPQSGKSHYANEFIKKYNSMGGFSLVYNQGRPRDFKDHTEFEIPDIYDLAAKIRDKVRRSKFLNRPFLPYFLDEHGGVAPFIQRSGGKVKINRAGSADMERAFFRYVYGYMYNSLLTIDDARPIFRNGLNSDMVMLFSRLNHTGKKSGAKQNGIDAQVIFHNLEMVNDELLDYATHIKLFQVNFLPSKMGGNDLYKVVRDCKLRLDKLPKYSSFDIEIETLNVKLNTPSS